MVSIHLQRSIRNGIRKNYMELSIEIPIFNHAKFLPYTLDLILNQFFQDFEIFIVDDTGRLKNNLGGNK
jgi:hypothetical protein